MPAPVHLVLSMPAPVHLVLSMPAPVHLGGQEVTQLHKHLVLSMPAPVHLGGQGVTQLHKSKEGAYYFSFWQHSTNIGKQAYLY